MGVFATAEELYSLVGKALSDFLTKDPSAAPFRDLKAVVAFEFTEPAALITLALEADATVVEFDSSDRVPDASASMTGDLAHEIMVSEQALAEALGRGALTLSQNDPMLLVLVGPLPEAARPAYIDLLTAAGRQDLIPQETQVFASEEEVYGPPVRALERLGEDDDVAKHYLSLDTVARIETSAPPATITLDLTGSTFIVETGRSKAPAEVDFSISGNSLDRLFRGELQATEAVGRGLLAYSGDTWKALELLSLPTNLAAYYRQEEPSGGAPDAQAA